MVLMHQTWLTAGICKILLGRKVFFKELHSVVMRVLLQCHIHCLNYKNSAFTIAGLIDLLAVPLPNLSAI